LYLSGDIIFKIKYVTNIVNPVHKNVINDNINGNIELVSHFNILALANVSPIFNAQDEKNVIASIKRLPKNPAINAHIELTHISWIVIFLGQKLIFYNNNKLKLLLR